MKQKKKTKMWRRSTRTKLGLRKSRDEEERNKFGESEIMIKV